jgi:hypothetical protein
MNGEGDRKAAEFEEDRNHGERRVVRSSGLAGRIDRLSRRVGLTAGRMVTVFAVDPDEEWFSPSGRIIPWTNGKGYQLPVPFGHGRDPMKGLTDSQR